MRVSKLFAVALGATLMAAVSAAAAFAGSAVDTVSFTVTPGSFSIDVNQLSFGASYVAVNNPASSASATVSPAIVLSNNTGTPGGARLVPVDASGINKMLIQVTGGIPNTTMSLQIQDNVTSTPYLTLTGQTTPTDATFKVDTWTYAVQPGGGTLTGFTPTTGKGTITLNSSGDITIWFGATLHTVPSALSYSAQTYSGTLLITVDY